MLYHRENHYPYIRLTEPSTTLKASKTSPILQMQQSSDVPVNIQLNSDPSQEILHSVIKKLQDSQFSK